MNQQVLIRSPDNVKKCFFLPCDFKILLTVFNQSYNCQTSHYLGRNQLPNAFLMLPSLIAAQQQGVFSTEACPVGFCILGNEAVISWIQKERCKLTLIKFLIEKFFVCFGANFEGNPQHFKSVFWKMQSRRLLLYRLYFAFLFSMKHFYQGSRTCYCNSERRN